MKLQTTFTLAATMIALPLIGFAEAAPTDMIWIMNTSLFLVGGFLVFFLAGFAMLEASLVRSKNVTMQLTKNMVLCSIACLAYYVIGYDLMYPLGTWGIEKVLLGVWGVAVMEDAGVSADGVDDYAYAATASDYFFQLMFCAATASIVSGALAERIKLEPFLIFTVLLTGAIYSRQASRKWGGGFLDTAGFLDFSGSTVVHSVGGWAALVGALILGPRLGNTKTVALCQCWARNCHWPPWGRLSCGLVGSALTAVRNWRWARLAISPTCPGFLSTRIWPQRLAPLSRWWPLS